MNKVKIFADRNLKVGEVDPKLYSSFIEHLGRAVYEGIYEPGHPTADEDGFRQDVAGLIRELDVPMVRYPGGNFVSGYNWRDGIGPRESRPTRLDLAWCTTETNEFGTDEFMKWCAKTGIQPMMAVNLGTGTPQEAAQLVEYCNHPKKTHLTDLRAVNGHPEPYGVKYWCLGNEMDGPWQICHLNAEDYSKKALEAAKMMRWVDPSVKLVACGSSSCEIPTFPEWDRIVLENLYDTVDYISMHRYYNYEDKLEDFLGAPDDMNNFVATIKATADYVKVRNRSKKRMMISFDEWNVWYINAPRPSYWDKAPHILEDVYSFQDALVFGGMMNTLLNNCDRVKIACLAQLVNVIAPIFTRKGGEAIKQTIFYPFQYVSNNARGEVIRTFGDAPVFDNRYGKARFINEAVAHDPDRRQVTAFVCNYAQQDAEVELELRGFGELKAAEHVCLHSNDLLLSNTLNRPDAVVPEQLDVPKCRGGVMNMKLKAMSWNMIRLNY